jgi:class 3 adenylate cyclase/alpha-beta hydrolase superfamily lysophospholipase
VSEIQYARADDDTHVAYRVYDAVGGADADHDVVMVPGGLVPIELFDEDPGLVRLTDGLRTLGRLIVFDRRGIGLSDPVVHWGERSIVDQWTDDLAAVMEASDARDATLFSWDGFGIATRYAAQHPERVGSLALYEPMVVADDHWDEFVQGRRDMIRANMSGDADILEWVAPSRMHDPAFLEWYARAGRAGASPATAQRIWESVFAARPDEHLVDRVAAPVLVLHRRDNEWVTADILVDLETRLPNVSLVVLDGRDHFPFSGDIDALVAEIADFVVGEHRLPPPERVLAAVMFTDLVGSTERAASIGDQRWKAMLDRHDAAIRRAVGRSGGTVVKTTGDGVLALFPSAAIATYTAAQLSRQLAADDLSVRIGIHVGDVDHRGDDVSGLAVNIAARVMSKAGANELFVTASVVASLAGQGTTFESVGPHDLKGVPGTWELFRAVSRD